MCQALFLVSFTYELTLSPWLPYDMGTDIIIPILHMWILRDWEFGPRSCHQVIWLQNLCSLQPTRVHLLCLSPKKQVADLDVKARVPANPMLSAATQHYIPSPVPGDHPRSYSLTDWLSKVASEPILEVKEESQGKGWHKREEIRTDAAMVSRWQWLKCSTRGKD